MNTVTIPLPPSAHRKSPQDKQQWRENVKHTLAALTLPPCTVFSLAITLHGPWFRTGYILDASLADLDRLATPIQDAVCSAIGRNDRAVFRLVVEKVVDAHEYAVVTVLPISLA